MYVVYVFEGREFKKDIIDYMWIESAQLFMLFAEDESYCCTPDKTRARRIKDRSIDKIKVLEYSI